MLQARPYFFYGIAFQFILNYIKLADLEEVECFQKLRNEFDFKKKFSLCP